MLCSDMCAAAAGRGSSGVTGPVSVHDGPVARSDSGHGDRQALRLQSARRGADVRTAELALPARHV